MRSTLGVGGSVDEGYGAVADAFAANFSERGDVGGSCAVWVGGRPVVDLWAGVADKGTGRPWEADTIAILFSITKGVATILALQLVERGQLDLDAPVTTYWPEFGAAGKEHTTVRHVFSHRTGLPWVDGPVSWADLADPAGMAARLAEQAPVFEPGTDHVYQAITFSWTAGEILRRITGRSFGELVREEITGPLDLDLWVGLPEELEARVAPIEPPDVPAELVAALMPEGSDPWKLLTLNGLFPPIVVGPGSGLNDPRAHAAEMPAANGISNARALARMYAATVGTVDGIRLLQPATIAAASHVQSAGAGWGGSLDSPTWGTGFLRPFPRQPMLSPASFGHDGAGGSIAFADPDWGVSFSHVINQMVVTADQDPRTMALIDALKTSLD